MRLQLIDWLIAAAYFAVKQVGGLDVLVQKLSAPLPSPDGKVMLHYLNILPLLGWTAGCAMIWSALFTVGNFL
jgi:hypothetical protein